MEWLYDTRIIISAVVALAFVIARVAAGAWVTRTGSAHPEAAAGRRRLVGLILIVAAAVALTAVWGVDVKNIWVFVTSFIGLVAIGFFAVWSILSNLVAGLFLVILRPFAPGDTVTLLPDDISGNVVTVGSLFLQLKCSDGAVLHIPNNLLFQKIVKRA